MKPVLVVDMNETPLNGASAVGSGAAGNRPGPGVEFKTREAEAYRVA